MGELADLRGEIEGFLGRSQAINDQLHVADEILIEGNDFLYLALAALNAGLEQQRLANDGHAIGLFNAYGDHSEATLAVATHFDDELAEAVRDTKQDTLRDAKAASGYRYRYLERAQLEVRNARTLWLPGIERNKKTYNAASHYVSDAKRFLGDSIAKGDTTTDNLQRYLDTL